MLAVGLALAATSLGCGYWVSARGPGVVTQGVAADFALRDQTGATLTLDALLARGPAVLVFYRGYWCPFCRSQLAELEEARTDLASIGATIVGISVDTAEESAMLAAKLGLHFPLLEDAGLRVALAYGVAMEGQDIAVPAVFIVRRDRVITWKHIGESIADRPTAALVLEKAKEAAGP